MWQLLIIYSIISVARAANFTQPTEDEVFGTLIRDEGNLKDVLYICDMLKSNDYSCNVTQLGVQQLKHKGDKIASSADQATKIMLFNVTGKWDKNDGFLKKNLIEPTNSTILARCFFRPDYYECFGYPRCDPEEAAGPCWGGEPWRGQYNGAPNIGFKGNITAQAVMSSPIINTDIQEIPEIENSTSVTVNETSRDASMPNGGNQLLLEPNTHETRDVSGSSTKITVLSSSPNKDQQVNITVWTSGNQTEAFNAIQAVATTNTQSTPLKTVFHQFLQSANRLLNTPIQSIFPPQTFADPNANQRIEHLANNNASSHAVFEERLTSEFKNVDNQTSDSNNVTSVADPCANRPPTSGFIFDFSSIQCMISNFHTQMVNSFWSSFPSITVPFPQPAMPPLLPTQPVSPRFRGFQIIVAPMDDAVQVPLPSGRASRMFDYGDQWGVKK